MTRRDSGYPHAMRRMLAKVEVQRVLILTFAFCVPAGAISGVRFDVVLLLAALATVWTFLLGWSLTLDSAVAFACRVAVGAAAAAGCAGAFGAGPAAVVVVALAGGGLLAGAEHLMRRRVAPA